METSPRHARAFKPRYSELDDRGETTPTAMMGLFEDAAFSHCEDTGWDVFRLRDSGFGWILLEGGFEMSRYPRYKEPFTVETWLSGARAFYGLRGFEVKDGSGAAIGRARSLWVFYDLERRRPAPVLPEILAAWRPDPLVVPSRGQGGVAAGGEPVGLPPGSPSSFDVRALDIDTNGHVNNVRYLEWALEAVPGNVREGARLSAISGRFIQEVVRGQSVTPVSERRAGSEGSSAIYRLAVYASGPAGPVAAAGPASDEPAVAACASSSWTPR
ncbi:MAG: acyl-ACP thioesterase [Spirochaetes bacterium]|nr:acyl-ACP thioesterase [Spirochaetota bacterium]MBU1081521.1 acyl-ACP thioesterase [Spirochaetota bacterium]